MKDKIIEYKGKFQKNIKKYFSTNILFLTYVILSVLIGFGLRTFTVGNVFALKPLLADITFVIIIGSFGYLIKPKNQFIYFISWIIFYTFLGVVNSIYYLFYSSFVSVNLLSTISMLGEVGDSVTEKLNLYHFIYILAPIILIVVHKFLCKKNYYFNIAKIEKGKKMFVNTIVSGGVIVALLIVTLTGTEISRFVKQWNREYIVQRFGIYTYTFNDLIQSLEPKVNSLFGYDDAVRKFKEYYSENKEKSSNKYTNIFKGKNVIFIHAESIQNFLIDLKINDIEITPNLNKIANEGLYFSSFYPQISVGTSSDTEFTLTTGLMPSSSGTVFINYYDRTYEAMPSLFKNLGYYTFSMHGNNGDYWNRNTMYKALGYDYFYSQDSYVVPTDKNDMDYVGLGLSDKSFFKQSIEKLLTIKKENKNFMGTIITLSNHSPFSDITKYGDLDFSITYTKYLEDTDEFGNKITEEVTDKYLEDTDLGNYLKSAHYADEALGQFFDMIKENNLDENTVFIIYGDHEAKLGKSAFNLLYNYDITTGRLKSIDDPTYVKIDSYAYDLLKNTPFIIWTSDNSLKGEITDVMGMYDVLPTVANMFGFEVNYALGQDIFSKSEKIVIFPNGNFLTNKVYYNNLKDEYLLLTNEPIETDYIEKYKLYSEVRLDVSKALITHDLIKNVAKIEGENNANK